MPPDEVVVVGRSDDLEGKRTALMLAPSLPSLRWAEVGECGFVAPVRKGLETSSGEIIAFLDDDAEPAEDWLENLLAPFEARDVACVGGRWVSPSGDRTGGGSPHARQVGLRWYGRFDGDFPPDGEPMEVDAVLEGTSAWRRQVLMRLQWAEIFERGDAIYYGLDLCLQARRLGYRTVYTPHARALHHAAPRAEGLPLREGRDRARLSGQNLTYVALARLTGLKRIAFLLGFLLLGQGQSPGIGIFLRDLLTGRADAWGRFAAALLGRVGGSRAWWMARKPEKRWQTSG